MFRPVQRRGFFSRAFRFGEVVYHASVRNARKGSGNAVMALMMNMVQACMMVAIFYVMMSVLGLRGAAVRGDFMLYVMSGIFMFLTHTKTVGAISGADGPTSAMMQHAPMNPIIAISAAAIGTLYTQVFTLLTILFIYHALINPITIFDPVGFAGMFLMAWGLGVAVGMIFMAARPWAPKLVGILTLLYQRANMIASGKMFLANTLPAAMLALFDWNPLFHIIDQGRGYMFLNYHPHNSSLSYPIKVMTVCFAIGLMWEFYTRKHASSSWGARD
ncbi:ABC transporter permease [Falsirhodobacter algicola]|uniref:ABC transporter permease n=1 Tax=Falsirhodobacter algicola TaxID=2692330 RepID=A0A8J8MUY0_9RHOB|nr:ABC transporter permease [Falsirhodobacter algicola]